MHPPQTVVYTDIICVLFAYLRKHLVSRLFNLLDLILPDDDGLALNRSSRDDVFFIFCLLKKKIKYPSPHL